MKRILLFLTLLIATINFSSCSIGTPDYQPSLFDMVVGRTWIGDLGVATDRNVPLESGISLSSNGFGEDELYFYKSEGGNFYGKITIRWSWSDTENTIYLDYGNVIVARELKRVRIENGMLCGDLYIYDPRYTNPFYGHVSLYLK